jgi:hypothetical protein
VEEEVAGEEAEDLEEEPRWEDQPERKPTPEKGLSRPGAAEGLWDDESGPPEKSSFGSATERINELNRRHAGRKKKRCFTDDEED